MAEKKEKPFVNTVNDASKMKVICKGHPDRTEDLRKKAKEESNPVEKKTPPGKPADRKGGMSDNADKT